MKNPLFSLWGLEKRFGILYNNMVLPIKGELECHPNDI
jgi:hypothetical protein